MLHGACRVMDSWSVRWRTSTVMMKFQNAGRVAYQRGRTSALDRNSIELCNRECYAVVERE